MRDSRWAALAGLAAIAAFLPALGGGFVYDDHRFIEANPHLERASILVRAFTDPVCQTADGTEAGLWRPLRTLSFALDRAVFGGAAWGPHLVSVLLHGAAVACVFALLRRFGARAAAAFAGAMLYALHPVQVECVAWISSRGDVLAALLVWAALLCDLSGRTRVSLAFGAAALLAKEQAAVWPALAWAASRLAGRGAGDASRRALGPAAVVVAFLLVRSLVLTEPGQQGGLGAGPARAPQLAAMLGHQAWYALVPVGSLFDWQMPATGVPLAAALVATAALAGFSWKPSRAVTLWFCAALAPTLFVQAFVPLNIMVADRFLLFALPAAAVLVARGVDSWRGGATPAVLIVCAAAVLTEAAIPVWRSDETLWGETARRSPGHPRANHWLGLEGLRAGRTDDAVARLRVAAAADPGGAKTRFDLAFALDSRGRQSKDPALLMEAFREYTASLALVADPRTERRAEIQAIAPVAAADAALIGGVDEFGAQTARSLIQSARPDVPESVRESWDLHIDSIARYAGANPKLGPAFADRVRTWGALP